MRFDWSAGRTAADSYPKAARHVGRTTRLPHQVFQLSPERPRVRQVLAGKWWSQTGATAGILHFRPSYVVMIDSVQATTVPGSKAILPKLCDCCCLLRIEAVQHSAWPGSRLRTRV